MVLRRFLLLLTLQAMLLGTDTARAQQVDRQMFVPVLIYHHVKWLKPSDDHIERGLTVLPRAFASQLAYLRENGFHTVTAAALVRALRTGQALPARAVVLTFDDGYSDVYRDVYRLLRDKHMTATFFIVPSFLGNRRYLTWNEVHEMAANHMDIEAHTLTHPDLRLVKPAQQWHEIRGSRQVLEQGLHIQVRVFAYPYGGYDSSIVSQVGKAGYWGAFTTQQGWQQSLGQIRTLPRVYIDLDDSLPVFEGRLRATPNVLSQDPY